MLYIQVYSQPLLVLLIGLVILTLIGYANWYGGIKERSVQWIARKIFRSGHKSDISANHLFMTVTVILLWIGIIWTGIGLMYLVQ